jgi:hypothetical protein
VNVDRLAGRRNAVVVAAVCAAHLEQHPHHVAFGDDLLDRVGAVGKRGAQIRAGARKALVARVVADVLEAGAPTLVARRQHLLHGRSFVLGALRFLETANDALVALELRGRCLRHCLLRA